MKKFLSIFFSLVLVLLFVSNSSLTAAQETRELTAEQDKTIAPDYYPRPDNPLPFAGQNHSYSVVLRGNGEAIVTLKAALTNTNPDGDVLKTLTFRLPLRVIPSDIAVYQIINQGNCIRYEPRIGYEPGQNMPGALEYNYQPRCTEYSEPDYFNYYGGGKYQRAEYEYSGDTLTINLPKPIVSEKSGAFFVYFRAMGYAKRNLVGAYKFNFESLKSNDQINQLNVGISTDSDLFLKGSKGKVEYRYEDATAMMKEAGGGAAPKASSSIDRVLSQVGQGTIIKNASNLAPLESYKVSGMYANSKIKLYGKEITFGLAVVLVFLVVIFLIVRKVLRLMSPAPVTLKKNSPVENKSKDTGRLILTTLGISFISSILLAGYSLLIIFISQNLNYIDYQTAALLRLAGMIFSFCVYSVIIFIPGVYFGVKKGIGWGILTMVLTVGWLFVYFIVSIGIIFLTGFQRSYPYQPMIQMMEGIRK